MKKLILLLLFVILLAACNKENENGNSIDYGLVEEVPGGIEMETESFSLEGGIKLSDIVVEVIIKEKVEEVSVEPIPYTVFSVEVQELYQGNIDNEMITIKQQGDSEWTVNSNKLFKEGERYIFFLKETKQSKSDYWIIGEETGFFQVLDSGEIVKLVESIAGLRDVEVDNVGDYDKSSLDLKIAIDEQILDKQKFIEKLNALE